MYVVTAPPPQPLPAERVRAASPPAMEIPPARRLARGRTASMPKKIDVRELEEKFKELQQQRKKDQSEQRELERQQRRETVNHQQTLLRQQRMAERDVLRREVEVDRLEKGLNKVRKETRMKSTKQSDVVAKIDDTLKRLEGRQQDLERQLEDKVKEAATAKGILSHIEFANTLLQQGQVAVPIGNELQDDAEGGRDALGASKGGDSFASRLMPSSSAGRTPADEEQLQRWAEELRSVNRRRSDENAKLRQQLEEVQGKDKNPPKPLFACMGGELGGGTFYNLWDEGLNSGLGPGFSFSASIRYDKFRRGSKVFDFGNGESTDNIYVGNRDETSTLVFGVYQGRKGSLLTVNDFWSLGQARDYLFVVTPEGQMKVFCEGLLVASKQGHALRMTERRQLYVGRSNWSSDAPFEGSVGNIKVWSRETEWSSAERSLKPSAAESWALGHTPPPAVANSCTYPNGATLQFPEFAPSLAPLLIANQVHRERILEEIESGNHARIAALVYQSQGWDLEGHLAWRSGEVCEFVKLVFQEFSLVPPNESQLYPLYAKFTNVWSNQLAALDCFCLADAALRVVFHTEVVTLGENDPSEGVPTGRLSFTDSMAGTLSAQPEASGQLSTGASTLRRAGSCEVTARPSWQPAHVGAVHPVPELALSGARISGATRPSPGHSSSATVLPSTGYGSTGQFSPSQAGTSARSPSPVSRPGPILMQAAGMQVPSPLVAAGIDTRPLYVENALQAPVCTAPPTMMRPPEQFQGLSPVSLYSPYMQAGPLSRNITQPMMAR